MAVVQLLCRPGAHGKAPLRVNVDETSVSLFQGQGKGTIVFNKRETLLLTGIGVCQYVCLHMYLLPICLFLYLVSTHAGAWYIWKDKVHASC